MSRKHVLAAETQKVRVMPVCSRVTSSQLKASIDVLLTHAHQLFLDDRAELHLRAVKIYEFITDMDPSQSEADRMLSYAYTDGSTFIQRDLERAFTHQRRGARHGDIICMFDLAQSLFFGNGTFVSRNEAIKYLKDVASSKEDSVRGEACYLLASVLMGEDNSNETDENVLELFKTTIKENLGTNVESALMLGDIYRRRFENGASLALDVYHKVEDEPDSFEVLFELAHMYDVGEGTDPDTDLSRYYYEKVVDEGSDERLSREAEKRLNSLQ